MTIKKETFGNITQILFCTNPQVSVGIQVANTGVVPNSEGKKIIKAGTPLYGSLLARGTGFTIGDSSTEESATATVPEGQTGITAATVTAATFGARVGEVGGSYEFVASIAEETTTWKLGSETVTLADYGIVATGTAADGDKITVAYTPATTYAPVGVILHDVDVTAGNANGSLLIFGFVDMNKLDSAVATLITSTVKAALDGKVAFIA